MTRINNDVVLHHIEESLTNLMKGLLALHETVRAAAGVTRTLALPTPPIVVGRACQPNALDPSKIFPPIVGRACGGDPLEWVEVEPDPILTEIENMMDGVGRICKAFDQSPSA